MARNSPYSGVAALFRSRVADGLAPLVLEDGEQMRDFVHVTDIARANRLALESPVTDRVPGLYPVNVCSGQPRSVGWAATLLAEANGGPSPIVTGQFRAADVRHVVASPGRAREMLGFDAAVFPGSGFREFAREPI
jgi:dTDP-L-rhamnose 4-epimerase